MEIGYYSHSKKIWINNRLDLNDAWKIERVTFGVMVLVKRQGSVIARVVPRMNKMCLVRVPEKCLGWKKSVPQLKSINVS